MKFTNTLKATVVAVAALVGTHASAATLTLGAGWSEYQFGSLGSSWDTTFDITIAATAYVKVTDSFCIGDMFTVSVDGGDVGETSSVANPSSCTGVITTDYDAAYASASYSSGWLALGAGSYAISGTVFQSFSGGGGAIELVRSLPSGHEIAPIPLPAAGLLLLGALGAGTLVGRRRKNK